MENSPLMEKYGRTLESGEIIFQENDEGEHMFIIQEGRVEILRQIAGKDHILAVLEKGDFFGEMAIVNRIQRTASARAADRTVLLAFDRNGFQQLVEKNPKIALNIIDKLCRRLTQANATIRHMAMANAEEHVYLNIYYQFLEKGGENQSIEEAQLLEELGINLNMPREQLLTSVAVLESKAVLVKNGTAYQLKNPAALQKIIHETEKA